MRISKGFTLIEVLVVIAIIAILATAVIIGISAFQGQARDARRISDLHLIQTMMEAYFGKHGQYPDNTVWKNQLRDLSDIIAIPSDPLDPIGTTRPYQYSVTSDNLHYVIAATLENNNNILKSSIALQGTQAGITGDCGAAVTDGYLLCFGN